MPNDSSADTTHRSGGDASTGPLSPAAASPSTSPRDDGGDIDEDLDEYAWTSPSPPLSASDPLHASLRDFDSNLRCPICHEFYRIPVSLPTCHHTFCSECIRVSLKSSLKVRRVSECPVCRVKADERRVVPNRCVEGIVRRFVELRGGLRRRLMEAATTAAVETGTGRANEEGSASERGGEVAGAERGDEGEADHASPGSAASSSASGGGRRTSSRVSSRRAAAAAAAANDDVAEDGDSDFEGSPVKAKVAVAKRGRGRPPKNNHRPSPPAATFVGTVPRPRASTHYHGLKRKQLISLLSNEGLSTSGTEKEMRDRHAEFVTLVNAECDAERPRCEEELRKELARRERARREERAASLHNGAMRDAECMERLKRSRKAAGEAPAAATAVGGGGTSSAPGAAMPSMAVSSGNAAFDGALDAGFRRLIADERRKRRRRKEGADGNDGGKGDVSAAAAEEADGQHATAGSSADREPGEPAGDGRGDDTNVAATASGAETTAADSDTPTPSAASLPVLDPSSSRAAVAVQPPLEVTASDGGCGAGNEGSIAVPTSPKKKPRANVGRGQGPARSFEPSSAGRSTTATSSPPVAARVGSISGPWNCDTCTYFNTVRVWPNALCEMCEVGRRPSPGGCRRAGNREHVVEVDC